MHASAAAAPGHLHLGGPRFAIVPPLPPAGVASDLPYLPQQRGNHCDPLALTAMISYRAALWSYRYAAAPRGSLEFTGADKAGSRAAGTCP